MSIFLAQIRIDGGTQPRDSIDLAVVDEYAAAMDEGAEFPPVVVYHDGAAHWLADGFHRYHAARKLDRKSIAAEILSGTRRDAVLHSVGANRDHGLRRTNADKRKAVETLLGDEEWGQWSDREIARRCGVTHPFVMRIRESLVTVTSEKPTERTYVTKHGTPATMRTENIGAAPRGEREEEEREGVRSDEPQRPTEIKGVGLRRAEEAIAVLKQIPYGDAFRDRAFEIVASWIEHNRRS